MEDEEKCLIGRNAREKFRCERKEIKKKER